ncbi:MAG: uroporphyrinogen-III C-methyltransferase [Rhodospirillales bacterium]|nr:uroporphyrinogen-III C-methyltransferase [Rhodospirillales bacterium]
MRHFPLFLDLHGRDVLVVGGGGAAARKALVLAGCGARVSVVAERPDEELIEAAVGGRLRLHPRPFADADVEGRTLVVSATEEAGLDASVSAAARARDVPINVVDRPALCTFLWPAIVDRDPLTVAVCSGGAAPVLARSVRARIEAMLPANLGRLARFADSFRAAIKATRISGPARRRFWEGFFEGPVAAQVLAGDERGARERMLATINRRDQAAPEEGIVHLVGAGPGDPELLTLKALRLLQHADVIVHDRLIGPRILDYARRDADRINVGKMPGSHAVPQDQINTLLLRHARAGRHVVRLKGGDPFVFGRGGEERDFLLRHGIHVEVVPGITAATGCAAAAGIPLTLRGEAQTLNIVTAHAENGESELDWPALARVGRTLCVYMGAAAAQRIAERLIEHGRDPETPAAVIVNGTLPEQQILTGPLRELAAILGDAGAGPALIVVGEVVRRAAAWAGSAEPPRLMVAAVN